MKKVFLIIFTTLITTVTGLCQAKIGIKFAPAFVNTRLKTSSGVELDTKGLGFNPVMGFFVDVPMAENYFFSIGMNYVSKKSSFEATWASQTWDNTYKLQYVQLPVLLKLLSNEVGLDKRVYFQFGPVVEVNVYNEASTAVPEKFITKITPVDMSMQFSLGLEYKMGVSSSFLGGISYYRGLINQARKTMGSDDIMWKLDLFSLDLGMKF